MNNLWVLFSLVVVPTVIAYDGVNRCLKVDSYKKTNVQDYCVSYCGNDYPSFTNIVFEQLCWCCVRFKLKTNNKIHRGKKRFNRDISNIDDVDFKISLVPLSHLHIANVTESSVHVSWQKPVYSPTTDVVKYQIKTEILHTYSSEELHSHEWTFSNNTFHSEIGGLHPATKYNISIRTVMADGMYGLPAYVTFETLIDTPDPAPQNPQVVSRQNTKMTVKLYPVSNNNGPITSYRLVVINAEQMQVFEPELLAPYHEAQTDGLSYYIAAQLNPSYINSLGTEFVLGDGKHYSGYFNAPLYENIKYIVIMGIVSSLKISNGALITKVRYGNETMLPTFPGLSTANEMSAVVVGLYVAIGLMTVILLAAVAVLFIVRRRYYRGRRQRLSDNQELTLQGPVIEVSNNGYIHDEEPVNYYDNLKQKVWRIPRHCLQMEQKKILGFGQFGHIVSGSVRQENKTVPCVSSVAVYIINNGDMIQDEKRAMLRALDVLIRAGQHDNLTSMIGTCESIDTVYVTWQHESVLLKDKLLASRSYSSEETNFSQLSASIVLDIAIGVASGMDHLARNNLVHEKLCARNVYLTDDMIPKVTGHGLSHFNHNNIILDMTRWTAQEVFKSKPTTTKSDVWSFGCFMWELLTLGGTPYSQLSSKQNVMHEISRGIRLPQLSYVGDEVYELMLQCWLADPDERPSFDQLFQQLNYFKSSLTLKFHISFQFYTGFDFPNFIPGLEIQQECI